MDKPQFNIGIDFGGVLSIHDGGNAEHKNSLINIPDALESVIKLKTMNHNLFIVSFCGLSRAKETKLSIDSSELNNAFMNQYYVKKKEYKGNICEYIGCHFMIDDRQEILDNIKRTNKKIITILFGESKQKQPIHKYASDWNQVIAIIESTPYFDVLPNHNIDISKITYSV